MEKNINIDGKEYKLVANGATPRKYRSLFRQDIFSGISTAVNAKGEILNSEVFENLAYCMALQGGMQNIPIEDWLDSMSSPLAILEAATEILELWTAETQTTSVGKKE